MRFLPAPVRFLLIAAFLYVGTYVALRVTNHLVLYHGSLLAGTWTVNTSIMDASTSSKFFHTSKIGAGILTPLAKIEAALSGPSAFNDPEGKTPLRGKLSKAEVRRRLPDAPEGWTVLGGWYEHREKGKTESFHAVFSTSSDSVASDNLLREISYNLANSSGAAVADKLQDDLTIDVHTFTAGSNVFRTSSEKGEWSEVVVDDGKLLACVSWGTEG